MSKKINFVWIALAASLTLLTTGFSVTSWAQKKPTTNATSLDASFSATDDKVTVSFTFENQTSKPMYLTDDGSPEVQTTQFEPTETCVLISKLLKPADGGVEVPVKATRVMPGKKYSNKISWSLPLHHSGVIPTGWSKTDSPKCQTLRFEIAAIPGYSDLTPSAVEGKKNQFLLSKEARRHQETQTAESTGFEIPISLE